MSNIPSISWHLIELLGLDQYLPDQPHIFNALVFGITERIAEHDKDIESGTATDLRAGEEWILANLEDLRADLFKAANYIGEHNAHDDNGSTSNTVTPYEPSAE